MEVMLIYNLIHHFTVIFYIPSQIFYQLIVFISYRWLYSVFAYTSLFVYISYIHTPTCPCFALYTTPTRLRVYSGRHTIPLNAYFPRYLHTYISIHSISMCITLLAITTPIQISCIPFIMYICFYYIASLPHIPYISSTIDHVTSALT